MNADDVKVAVSHFLELVVNGRGDEEDTVDALETALDMLAWIQNLIEPTAEAPSQQPEREFGKMRALIAEQFPSFGLYGTPAKITDQNGTAPAEQSNAVDDLAEIACHLYEVAWRFQNTSDEDALASFAENYRKSWRSQLRGLQWYIEARRHNHI